ncbi:MAG: hypothetical protein HY914_07345 [Desulfomonile tiedjei]|nr:hypothetical protein [Desulfomonile tiedjei]
MDSKIEDAPPLRLTVIVALFASMIVLLPHPGSAFETVDVISGIIESPTFKGKDPIAKLRLSADLLKAKRIKPSDLSFVVLDWADQYLREPRNPLERLKRWAELCNDEELGHLRMPREFLNRILLAEYLVADSSYLKAPPYTKLEIVGKLTDKNLVDWAVALAYARIYAGCIIAGAKTYENLTPSAALEVLKNLKETGLVGWHYKVPTEGVLVAEALAMDPEYQKGSPYDRLMKLRDLESRGLISSLTRKELEKLPAWRLLVHDPAFLKSDPAGKRARLLKLKQDALISASTYTDLAGIFRQAPMASPEESTPAPLPKK